KELLKNYVKIIAYDQIKYALANSNPSLQEGDLNSESQKNINDLTDESASNDNDVKSTKKIRNGVLEDVKEIQELFSVRKEFHKLFSEEITVRLELAEKNH